MTAARAVVFDLDGTLIDSAPALHNAAVKVLADLGRPPIDLATLTSFIGNGVPTLMQRMRDHCGLTDSSDALVARFDGYYHADPVAMTELYPGVRAALQAITARGDRIGLCTNKSAQPARDILDHFGLAELFSCVLGGDSLPQRKPDPAPLQRAMAEIGAAEGLGLYVGDSEVDAETAHRAELPFILYTPGYRKSPVEALAPAEAFDDFAALPAILARLAPLPG